MADITQLLARAEEISSDAERGDLVVGQRRVDRGVEREQAARSEGVRLGVVLAVVEGDQAQDAGTAGEGDLAELGLGDALGVRGDLLRTREELGDVSSHVRPPLRSSGGSPR